MGVLVTAFSQVNKESKTQKKGKFDVFIHPAFPGRADEFQNGRYDAKDHLVLFSASYSSYQKWRDFLAKLAGYPEEDFSRIAGGRTYCAACWRGVPGPFSELINFSDCEGTIGTAVSKKLAQDFKDYKSKVDCDSIMSYNKSTYEKFLAGFELASDNGCVILT